MGRATVLLLLVLMAVGAVWAASTGLGARALGEAEMRAGSIGGPAVIGRGPRVGK
ncbi:MAG: hypothetical protein AAF845_19535 [Bacteroidota bacterium]